MVRIREASEYGEYSGAFRCLCMRREGPVDLSLRLLPAHAKERPNPAYET